VSVPSGRCPRRCAGALLRRIGLGAAGIVLVTVVEESTIDAQTTARAVETGFVLRNATVIDGTGRPPRSPVDVHVRDGRIDAIVRASRGPHADDDLDATGCFVVPGLWDLHVHPDDPEIWPLEPADTDKEDLLALFVVNGVTSVRDMGGKLELLEEWKRRIGTGELLGPRFHVAGPLVDGPEPMWPGSVAVDGPATGRRVVDELVRDGVDFVKVYSLLSPQSFHGIAERCVEIGMPFSGHVPRGVGVLEAARAGMRSQEHLLGFLAEISEARSGERIAPSEERPNLARLERVRARIGTIDRGKLDALARGLAEAGTTIVPTMILWRSRAVLGKEDARLARRLAYLPEYLVEWWRPERNVHLAHLDDDWREAERLLYEAYELMFRALLEAGVPLLPGTDTGGNPHLFPGFSLHDELEIFVANGMSPIDALRAATLESARLCDRADELGSVEEGKLADLVVLGADPLADIGATREILAVVHGGRLLRRTDLDRVLARLAE